MDNKPFGVELLLDANDCQGNIASKEIIQEFIDILVKELDMKKKGETHFEYFEDNEYNRERDIVGYSVVQIISLSNITIHINEISKTVYLNLFTCGKLDDTKVLFLFNNYFKPMQIKQMLCIRDARSITATLEPDNTT